MVKKFKIVVFGEGAVGKTSLIKQYTDASFQKDYLPTIGVQFCIKNVILEDGEEAELMLWDVAGQDRFRFVRRQFFQGAVAGIAVYDITRQNSLDKLEEWFRDFYAFSAQINPCILLGNKVDLEDIRQVDKETAETYWLQRKLVGYYETSALTGDHVDEAFQAIANAVIRTYAKMAK